MAAQVNIRNKYIQLLDQIWQLFLYIIIHIVCQ